MYFVLSSISWIALFLEKFTPLVKNLHWRQGQISPLFQVLTVGSLYPPNLTYTYLLSKQVFREWCWWWWWLWWCWWLYWWSKLRMVMIILVIIMMSLTVMVFITLWSKQFSPGVSLLQVEGRRPLVPLWQTVQGSADLLRFILDPTECDDSMVNMIVNMRDVLDW